MRHGHGWWAGRGWPLQTPKLAALLLLLAALYAVGCDSSGRGTNCTAGSWQHCACPDGTTGISRCSPDAMSWTSCQCGNATAGAGANTAPTAGTGGVWQPTGGGSAGSAGSAPTGGTAAKAGDAPPAGGSGGEPPIGGSGGIGATGGTDAGTVDGGGVGGFAGAAGQAGSGGAPVQQDPVCEITDPSEFQTNLAVGGGGTNYRESDHFVLFNSADPDTILNFMEAAEQCFVQDSCWRSSGLSTRTDDSGPFYKTNIYSMAFLTAGGYSAEDMATGLSYIQVLSSQASDPRTTVHEWGHCLTIAGKGWINQTNTGLWWESVANYVAYTFLTSSFCENARNKYAIQPLTTIIDQMRTIEIVYNNSYKVILYSYGSMDSNHYQAWPIWTYLTNNPDNYPGIGRITLPEMWRTHQGNNETPIHQLERMAAPVKAQTILGRYWARMAYFDIGLPVGQQDFLRSRNTLNFAANLDSAGGDTYTVKAARQPQYFGANITPLTVNGSGEVGVQVTNSGNGLPESNFTATLAIFRSSANSARYVDLPGGSGQATVESGEEVSLVVVNTPDSLYMYLPQGIGSPENVGLNYQVQITGAVPTN